MLTYITILWSDPQFQLCTCRQNFASKLKTVPPSTCHFPSGHKLTHLAHHTPAIPHCTMLCA